MTPEVAMTGMLKACLVNNETLEKAGPFLMMVPAPRPAGLILASMLTLRAQQKAIYPGVIFDHLSQLRLLSEDVQDTLTVIMEAQPVPVETGLPIVFGMAPSPQPMEPTPAPVPQDPPQSQDVNGAERPSGIGPTDPVPMSDTPAPADEGVAETTAGLDAQDETAIEQEVTKPAPAAEATPAEETKPATTAPAATSDPPGNLEGE